jgi:hypothetical protein
MARRLPSTPPNLPGFSYIRVLGSGGFADVFLYEQNMPRRQVAVKVMLSEVVTPQVRQMFQAEANLMAQLSTHPSVLTVYQASVSSDGRPYLVMELCSPSLSQRYRNQQISVDEVLRVGIKIASAVETAHRAGVLHRDIKPSNILTTAYGNPVLSDFGIASTLGEAELKGAVGLSIPWSAPEVITDQTPGSVASEVWSLGATLYTLLAGRSPFEIPGKDNGTSELIARIQRARPLPIGRADVPQRLEAIILRSLSRQPAARQSTTLEFARQLQAVEAELGLTQTPVEVAMDDWALATATDPDERTQLRTTGPGLSAGRRRRRETRATATSDGHPSFGSGGVAVAVSTGPGQVGRTTVWLLVVCAALVVALGATAVFVLARASANQDIPTVHDVSGQVSGSAVVFSWNDPGISSGDVYQVRVNGGVPSIQRSTQFRVDSQGKSRICVTVTVGREGQVGSPSAEKCVDPRGGP